MKCTAPLIRTIVAAIESVDYGSVKINLSDKGSFVEIITEKKERIEKEAE